MAQLIANTKKLEVDSRLQQLSASIMTMREQVTVLYDWRQPLTEAQLVSIGYDTTQVAEMSSFINIAFAWVEMIGTGGTMSANDGQLFERMLVSIHGLGGMAGIVTVPPDEPPA
jgi:hypothetical protein